MWYDSIHEVFNIGLSIQTENSVGCQGLVEGPRIA